MSYPIHPAAELFPMMGDREFEEFKRDIETHGIKEFGTLYKGQLLDGRNRYKACQELGIEMDFCEIEDSEDFDPFAYVLSHNLHRRHLTESQRAMVAAKLAKLRKGDVGNGRKVEVQICPSIEAASKSLQVSERSTKSAKKVIAEGSKEVQQAVEQGELPVSVAAELVKKVPDKAKQSEIVSKGKEAVREAAKQSSEPKAPKQPKVQSVVQQSENEVNQFLLFWADRTELGKRAIWLWLQDNYA